MKILIKNAKIVAPGQSENGHTRSLLIEDGIIKQIAAHIDTRADKEIALDKLHLSPGWLDPFAHFCDPGLEHKETLESGASAAAVGGFTTVFVLPNTRPVLDSCSQIAYISRKAQNLPVNIFPIGAISQSAKGENLAEMFDMQEAGAMAFSDGLHPVQNPGLMLKALEYVRAFNGTIIQIPEELSLAKYGIVHEGIWSTRLGISGIPDIAEISIIKRDIDLLKYTDSRLHITGLSLAQSVKLIQQAKAEGLNLSCSVSPYHLLLTDENLQSFDSNYKVNPPLRTQEDVEALRKGLQNGIIDCLATHHLPQDIDSKDREFEYAEDGMIGMETAFGLLGKAMPELSVEDKIKLLAVNPRNSFNMETPKIEEGAAAEITLFNPDQEWEYNLTTSKSKSRNTPFHQTILKGKPLGTITNNNITLND